MQAALLRESSARSQAAVWHSTAMRNAWIKERLQQLGKTQAGLGRHLDLPRSRVSEMIKGGREIQTDEVGRLAGFLELSENEVLRRSEGAKTVVTPYQRIRIDRFVQGGYWCSDNTLPESEVVDIYLPPIEAPSAQVYGLRVKGNSMDQEYPDGSIVFCVPVEHLPRALQSGDHVVVERRQHDEMEATVKELQQAADGTWWLVPRSTDPRHQTALPLEADGERYDDGSAAPVAVTGLVVYDLRRRATW